MRRLVRRRQLADVTGTEALLQPQCRRQRSTAPDQVIFLLKPKDLRDVSRPETEQIVFYVLLTVHLSIFISVFNQFDAQILFHNKFYFMPLHVSSTCAHHQEVKIVLHSPWYHHIYRCDYHHL